MLLVAHTVQAGMETQFPFTPLHPASSNSHSKKKKKTAALSCQDPRLWDFNLGGREGRETKGSLQLVWVSGGKKKMRSHKLFYSSREDGLRSLEEDF